MSANSKSFAGQMAKLEEILEWFEQDEIDLDQAMTKYEAGLKLTKELEGYLETAENKVKVIKTKHQK